MVIQIRPNPDKDPALAVTNRVAALLSQMSDVRLVMLPELKAAMNPSLPVTYGEDIRPDVYLVLGGDGSVIRTAHLAAGQNIPILSVNLGRMGYLCEIKPEDIQLLCQFAAGEYDLEKRSMLTVTLTRGNQTIFSVDNILNEVTVTRGIGCGIADLAVTADGKQIGTTRADGMVFFTPTGSSAYAMSAGGPLLDAGLSAIGAIPLCPHAGMGKCRIFRQDTVLQLENRCGFSECLYIVTDGIRHGEMKPGDILTVASSPLSATLVRIRGNGKRVSE